MHIIYIEYNTHNIKTVNSVLRDLFDCNWGGVWYSPATVDCAKATFPEDITNLIRFLSTRQARDGYCKRLETYFCLANRHKSSMGEVGCQGEKL